MANTKSAMKRMRQGERRRLRNRAVRTKVRSAVKAARQPDGNRAVILDAIRTLDKAVSKGVLHRNTAARKKSGLARRLAARA